MGLHSLRFQSGTAAARSNRKKWAMQWLRSPLVPKSPTHPPTQPWHRLVPLVDASSGADAGAWGAQNFLPSISVSLRRDGTHPGQQRGTIPTSPSAFKSVGNISDCLITTPPLAAAHPGPPLKHARPEPAPPSTPRGPKIYEAIKTERGGGAQFSPLLLALPASFVIVHNHAIDTWQTLLLPALVSSDTTPLFVPHRA